ncbi:TonB family protein [Pararhodobacter zhoushanensis]|uniref:TonB family protein n=1 Tax=Pararhodobacter zhoushanensis TaxID=2479545 RepID=A0ABT3GWX0_9RHOB|nr:TonB family protein [Pararhodobacter zhoushanensis]MCW1932031.1 TonB family protein [Pararhodobacter zhoushanensis]
MILSAQARRAAFDWRALAMTGAVSVAAHGILLSAFVPSTDPVQIAGGAASAPAALGSAFEDFTQGALPSTASMAESTQAPVAPQTPPAQAAPPPPPPAAAEATQTPTAPQTPAAAAAPRTLPPAAVAGTTPLAAQTPSTPPEPLTTARATPVQPTPPSPPSLAESAPTSPLPTATPEPDVTVRTADATTPRPQQRPSPQQASAAQPAGNSERSARRGSADGTTGAATQRAERPATAASAPGNAEASNYPGQVMRAIRRVRQQSVRARGVAVVAFTVAPGGGLASVSIAQASGSRALDSAALDHIRRAAPFPAPPPGAQRRFSFEFVGR